MMAYMKSKTGAQFVVSIIHNDKPLREFSENGKRVCRIPFGSEYKIRIKNKSDRRALAALSIDGTDVLTGGKRVVLPAYGSVDIERFVDDLTEGKRFKFISVEEGERTGAIQDPTSLDNGFIRVLIYPEKEPDYTWTLSSTGVSVPPPLSGGILRGMSFGADTLAFNSPVYGSNCSTNLEASRGMSSGVTATLDACLITPQAVPASDKGATVEGTTSNQEFRLDTSKWEVEETPVTFEILLRGPRSEQKPRANGNRFVIRIKDGSIRVETDKGRIYTKYIGFEGNVAVIKTTDFEFANSLPKHCLTITPEGFLIKTSEFQMICE